GLTMVLGSAPTVYTDAQIAAGDLVTDGVTILILSRKVVVSTITSAYVQGVRDFIASGGSLIAEYDGAALLFDSHEGVTPAFVGHFAPSVGLFEGEISGGGLLIPTSFSTAFAIDSSHPVWMGVPETLETGLRAAFAVANYPSSWLT